MEILRWDNAPHHKHIATYPHHQHLTGKKIVESRAISLQDVPVNKEIIVVSCTVTCRAAVIIAEHLTEYPPVYSPDLNPIERKRAQAKALGRKHRCSVDELFQQYEL